MADAISLGASIITLLHTAYAIQEVIRYTISLHRKAPEEINALQKQVEIFQSILLDAKVAGQQDSDGNRPLRDAISEAQAIVDDLLSFISQKLMRQGRDSYQARRKAWLRYKKKVVVLGERLKNARENVNLALSTGLLSTTRRIDSRSIDIDRRLEDMESGFKRLDSAVALAIQESRRDTPCSLTSHISRIDQPRNGLNMCQKQASDNSGSIQKLGSYSDAVPLGSILGVFECQESFLPETYTMRQSTPLFFCYDAFEAQVSDFQRVNHCSILYSPTPRKWLRLTAIVTISIESPYWSTWNSKLPEVKSIRNCQYLPASMERNLESTLRRLDGIDQDCVLEAYSGGKADLKLVRTKSLPCFDVRARLGLVTNRLYHQGFPAYHEKDLVHQPLPSSYFIAKIPDQPQWWLEIRFRSIEAQLEDDLYFLDVVTSCAKSPRITAFGGLVLDDDGIATGFLVEAPTNNIFDGIGKLDKSGQPIVSLERREKWCRQLIEAVSEVHRQGKVVGSLGHWLRKGVGTDTDDNLVLWKNFWTTFPYRGYNTDLATLPPEYHHHLPAVGQRIPAVPETDLYQLGLALWQLAANTPLVSQYCLDPCCTDSTCSSPHTFPVHLKPIGAPVPVYLEQIIGICLNEDPTDRQRAMDLLELLPAARTEEHEAESGEPCFPLRQDKLDRPGKPKDLVVSHHVWCSLCGKTTSTHYFHCSGCSSGDFDICPSCFTQGCHCSDHGHYLMEIQDTGGNSEESYFAGAIEGGHKYFTSPKQDGHRDSVYM